MLTTALKAKIPIIGIQTEDLVNVDAILQSIAARPVAPFPTSSKNYTLKADKLYVQDATDSVTVDLYRRLLEDQAQLVVVNAKPNSLIFDAGTLQTPDSFIIDYLKPFTPPEAIAPLLQVLVGLSLKGVGEVVQLTMARTGANTPLEVRHTRMMLGGHVAGLESLDTSYDFYLMPDDIGSWVGINRTYFLDPTLPVKLRPRGLLFDGNPGVGKTMAARVIAHTWDVPLFRLDLGAVLSRWLGTSERQIMEVLSQVEKNSPCVLLMDEMEKLFSEMNDAGTTQRILAQLLWWLAEHRSRVLTIMTTNNYAALPPELYRPGRVNEVFTLPPLPLTQAPKFAAKVYESIMGEMPHGGRSTQIRQMIYDQGKSVLTQGAVTELVAAFIKKNNWVLENKELTN